MPDYQEIVAAIRKGICEAYFRHVPRSSAHAADCADCLTLASCGRQLADTLRYIHRTRALRSALLVRSAKPASRIAEAST